VISEFHPIAAQFTSDLLDTWTIVLVFVVLVTLGILLFIGQLLKRQPESHFDPAIIRTFNKRVSSWLTICGVLVVSLLMHKVVTVVATIEPSFGYSLVLPHCSMCWSV
jgi:heme/copper-type cytochrome/quinol oxidase subunit 2